MEMKPDEAKDASMRPKFGYGLEIDLQHSDRYNNLIVDLEKDIVNLETRILQERQLYYRISNNMAYRVVLYVYATIKRVRARILGKSYKHHGEQQLFAATDRQLNKLSNTVSSIKTLSVDPVIEETRQRLLSLGFTRQAYIELNEAIKFESPIRARAAAWELAVWHANKYSKDDAKKCLGFLEIAGKGESDRRKLRKIAILKAEAHMLLEDTDEARAVINGAMETDDHADLCLAAASLEQKPQSKMKWINKALAAYSISAVSYKSKLSTVPYDCLSGTAARTRKTAPDEPKVTIAIPTYNARETIHTTLKSVLGQSWSNIEVLVIDDCSTDDTAMLVEEYTRGDPRVKLLRTPENSGPYIARNIALQHATGEFVTCNDADDWSHPEKIRHQAEHLVNNPSVIANTSQQARMTNDLVAFRRGNDGYYVFVNFSSLMFRRKKVTEAIGYYDSVRFGADTEFIRRVEKQFGKNSIIKLRTGPLSFQRQTTESLTGNSTFGYPGFFMGARKEYKESYENYYKQGGGLYYDFPVIKRPFPVPEPMLPNRKGARRKFDVIIVSDFRFDGGSTKSNIEEIKAQIDNGLHTGLVQMYRYDYPSQKAVSAAVRELLDGEKVEMIVYGERVETDVLLLRYPPALHHMQRYIPGIKAKDIQVVINQTPMSDYGPEGVVRYSIPQVQKNLEACFGKEGKRATWSPIGPLVREALYKHHKADISKIKLSNVDWVNIINVNDWKRSQHIPRRSRPIIGRHSRPGYVKWPADREEILQIYPDRDYEVHILGGGDVPKKILGGIPRNWVVHEFNTVNVKDFLDGLDVFVYYTHPSWVESFGRVIIEAMAVGVPVIIPPAYKPLFADAAIYAKPSEVKKEIDKLMKSPKYYDAQVEKAWAYVEKNFGYGQHQSRIKKLLQHSGKGG